MVKKKGLFFTIDAILAVGILLGTLIVITTFYVNVQPRVNLDYIATDLINVLAELKISEIENDYVDELINNGNITHLNYSLLDQIGEFWAEGNTELALNFTKNITEGIIPANYGYEIVIEGDSIYGRNKSVKNILSTSSKIISGVEKSKPIEGTVAQTYLLSIQKKRTESYAYFGGFVGQGNLTKYISDVPGDANITEMILELDAGDQFDFYINDTQCMGTFTPMSGNLSADRWDITSCNGSILNGTINEFDIRFTDGDISDDYVGGGYIKLKYTTSEMTSSSEVTGTEKYWFPGIEGLINLYSSINIPGNLTAWRLNMTLYNNYTTFLVIGNETVVNISGSNETQYVYRERTNLSIPSDTIPIRMGIVNVTEMATNATGMPADAILSTDLSLSMDACVVYSVPYQCNYDCFIGGSKSCSVGDPSYCSGNVCGGFCWFPFGHQLDCQTKLDIAKNASKLFVDIVLNNTGHHVGLNSYSTNVLSFLDLTDDKPTLYNRIDSYSTSIWTCICCGVNRAKNQLSGSTNKRSIVVMSDGVENYYCDNYNDYSGSMFGSVNASEAGQNACSLGIDVYSVGFGADVDHEAMKQIACNESMYFNATNVSQLAEIYEYIGGQIGINANYSAQMISLNGSLEYTRLFPNSSIEFDFIPLVDPPKFGEISINIASDVFKNCSPKVYLYDDITATDVKLTSYSSQYWTDLVTANGVVVWNLSKYGQKYDDLGDPFIVQIPPNLMVSGAVNNFTIKTGNDPFNNTGCSENNSLLVYRGTIKANVAYTSVLANAEGCNWYVEFDDGSFGNLAVPSDYMGSKECNFTSTSIDYDLNDTIDTAALQLFDQLDFDNDNRSDVNVNQLDMYIGSFLVPEVPSMWGPSVAEVRVW